MELTIKNTIVLIIAIFFIITYLFSAFEKIADWKGTLSYYKALFKDNFIEYWVPASIAGIVIFEFVILIGLLYGGFQFILNGSISTLYFSYIISAFLLLTFLIGQRLIKDYQGANSIVIYLIVNILGFYFLM